MSKRAEGFKKGKAVTKAHVAAAEKAFGAPLPAAYVESVLQLGAFKYGYRNAVLTPQQVVTTTAAFRKEYGTTKSLAKVIARTVFVESIGSPADFKSMTVSDGAIGVDSETGVVRLLEYMSPGKLLRPVAKSLAEHWRSAGLEASQVKGLDAALKKPKGVRSIELGDVDEISPRIAELVDLEVLCVQFSDIREVPLAVAKLSRLRKLEVGFNAKLKSIPDEVLALPNLEEVVFYDSALPKTYHQGQINALLGGFAKMTPPPDRTERLVHVALLLGHDSVAKKNATPEMLARALKSNVKGVREGAARLAKAGKPAAKAKPAAPQIVAGAARLAEMLSSIDDANVKLAVTMMKSGGVPAGVYEELFAIMQNPKRNAKVRADAKALWTEHAPAPAQKAVAKVMLRVSLFASGESKVSERLDALGKESKRALDPLKLALLLLPWRRGFKYVFEHGSEAQVLRALESRRDGDTLDLDGGELSDLPVALAQMKGIRKISLAMHELSRNHLTRVPQVLTKVQGLEEVDLSDNRLAALDDTLAKVAKLARLDLSNNFFRKFPAALCKLDKLESLDLSTDLYGGEREIPLRELPEEIRSMKSLRTLTLRAHQPNALPDALLDLPKLKELHLEEMKVPATAKPLLAKLRARGVQVTT